MLLFGSLLLSAVLVATQSDLGNRRFKVCIQESKVMSVEPEGDDGTLQNGCSTLRWQRNWAYSVNAIFLNESNIMDFEKGWYRVHEYPLHKLFLDNNEISEITSNILNDLPETITSVWIRRNKIERLRKGTMRNEHLSVLSFSANSIQVIEDGALANIPQLEYLYLNRNRLSNTQFVATLPQNLKYLRLQRNEITEISAGSFSKLNQLRDLSLRGNNITELQQQAFQGLTGLQTLELDENPLEKIEYGTFNISLQLGFILMDNPSMADSTW